MHWVTNRLIHYDRVASCWLIKRFIDADAEFGFIEPGAEAPSGATTFSMVGGDIGRHDKDGTTFSKLIKRHEIKDATLAEVERIVSAGVAYVMEGKVPTADDRHGQIAVGLLSVAEGALALSASDHEVLTRSLPVWDAVYVDAGLHLLRTNPPHAESDGEALRNTKFVMTLMRHLNVERRLKR